MPTQYAHSLRRYLTETALYMLFAVIPLSAQGATVHYNDLISYNGFNNVTTTLSINFTYNTDSRSVSEVSGMYNDGSLRYKIYNENAPQYDPTANLLNILFVNTDINFSRRNYFNTFFFADNTAPDPLKLAYQSPYYNESRSVVFCTVAKCTPFSPTDEKLTNLDLMTALPIPPAFALFVASLIGIGFVTKNRHVDPTA
jgi:hypothetical protein